jgi:F-type H+-transporting ATPase subunit b
MPPLVTPSFGLIVWMLIGFGILFFVLAKFAWPVITKMLNEREQYIQQQLDTADQVKQEFANMELKRQQMLIEAKDEREKFLSDTRKMVDKMRDEAKHNREKETDIMMAEARNAIKNEKMKAITEIKNEIANLSIEVAEKILGEELKESSRQEEVIQKWVEEMK